MTGGSDGRTLTPAELRQRSEANRRHGARSQRHISPLAKNLRRRVLRRLRIEGQVRDLDPVSAGYLDAYCRAAVKLQLYDAWLDEHGLVREDGSSPSFMPTYVALLNSSRLALTKLEDRLGIRVNDPLPLLIGEGRRIAEARTNGAASTAVDEAGQVHVPRTDEGVSGD